MEILWFKTLSLLVIFSTGLFAGIAPRRLGISLQGEQKLTLSNAFSAGIFLGAGLLHMLPDAQENFQTFAGEVDFPFPALIAGVGFLLILLLEKAALGGTEEDVGSLSQERIVYPFILCLVLSVHSIIAGISLGLEATLVSATAIFIAIIAHKGAAAFSLGVSLKENDFPTFRHVLIIVFAAMTPLASVLERPSQQHYRVMQLLDSKRFLILWPREPFFISQWLTLWKKSSKNRVTGGLKWLLSQVDSA